MRTVSWDGDHLTLIDQRKLPALLQTIEVRDAAHAAAAIKDMIVRGAPAIGVSAAFGLVLAARQSPATSRMELMIDLERASRNLTSARPTAVNLTWALDRLLSLARTFQGTAQALRVRLEGEAQRMADEDVEINKRMATHGATLLSDGDTVIHHCNTGALAAVDWGTALGAIRMAHEQGKRIHVLVDETRPRLQGARLTAWELEQYGISYEIITDSMSGHFLKQGQAQKVMFGADRVTANGDVANKIGTYMLALAAHDNGVPAYAVVPTSSIDLSMPDGSLIPIEDRDPREVLSITIEGEAAAPVGARARNPAFDVTPNRLVTAFVTEHGIARPPYAESLRAAVA